MVSIRPALLTMSPKIMIVAGEASADLHASTLVSKLKELLPELQVYGVGGEKLRAAGANIWFDFSQVSIVGVLEAVPKLKFFLDAFLKLIGSIKTEKPDLVLLLDLPDFNLKLARVIRCRCPGQKMAYYISPQVWAWRKYRIRAIKKCMDLMLVILPFEVLLYEKAGARVRFVGHPLTQIVKPSKDREQLRQEFGIGPDELAVAFLPGSRKSELSLLVPASLSALAKLQKEFPLKVFFARAPTLPEELVKKYLAARPAQVEIVSGRTYDLLFASDLGLLGSGTATLEAALADLPMLILGRLTWLNYLLVRPLAYITTVGLPNLIAQKPIVPELIMSAVNPERIYIELKKLITSQEHRERIKADLRKVAATLGEKNANQEAALAIAELIRK